MDHLIYGKDSITKIVSCEILDDKIELFRELENGSIETSYIPNRFWILSTKPFDKSWIRLKGDLYYKYGKQFKNREDFLATRQILKNHDIFSIYDPKEAAQVWNGVTYFKDMKVQDVSVLAFDIEATTLEHNNNSKVLLIANTFRRQGKIERKLFSYNDYKSDKEFFDAWCSWVREKNPSILVGHNLVIYDLPYLNFCSEKAGTSLVLGRNDSKIQFNNYESKVRKDGSQSYAYNKCHIYGREIVDTFFLALKYDIGRKYENYKLKQIIKQEGLEVKDRQFYDAEKIRDNYKNPEEWEKIKQYAIHDGDDALAIYDLMIPSFFYATVSIPKPFQLVIESAPGSQINTLMIRSYLQEGHSLPKANEPLKFQGAISFGNTGLYSNCFKVDVKSLYPSIMIQYEVYNKEKDPKANFLQMVRYFTTERLKNKKLAKETGDRYYSDLEQSEKVFINSAYGFLGAPGLLFNDPPKAAFITEKGREILQTALDWAKNNAFQIINADTDSITYTMDGWEISPDQQKQQLKELNSLYPSNITFEEDGYFKKCIVIKAKNYILQYPDNKVKIKGSALLATTKESALQKFIKETINLFLENKKDEVLKLYHKYVGEILLLNKIDHWCAKKTVTESVLNPGRTNEQKIFDALENEDIQEGDKIYVYFTKEGKLKLKENWSQDHDEYKLLEKLYKTILVFEPILDMTEFVNYSLKTKRKLLIKPLKEVCLQFVDNEIKAGKSILPQTSYIFKAFSYFQPQDTKVIILGQDPYPNKEDAMGLAFSVNHNKIPASLRNIYKELNNDLGFNIPESGNLEEWAKQGVLLLNSVLTVEEGKSAFHSGKGWEKYTTSVIQKILDYKKPLVLICWGKYAQEKISVLQIHNKCLILQGAHPSPFSANNGFFGGKYFSKCNEWLKKHKIEEINWSL